MPDPHLRKRFEALTLLILGFGGVLSLVTGVRHAFIYSSHDLQWMGGRLLGQHIDPWQERLANYPHHVSHFSPPNYLYLLYLLWWPLRSISFPMAEVLWCGLSIGFSIASVALLQRLFSLTRFQTLLVLFFLWMSSPMRVVLEVGQMSLFELFFFCLAYAAASTWLAGAAFGVSLIKYSFSPSAVVLFLLRRRFGLLLVAALVTLAGLAGVWLLLPTPLLQLVREPFQVSRIAVSPGVADLMTFSEFALRAPLGMEHARTVAYGLGLAGSIGYAAWLSRFSLSRRAELTLISVASLFFLKHLIYDYVFLVVPLAYALSSKNAEVKKAVFPGVFIFWALAALLNRAANDFVVHLPALAFNVLLMAAFVAFVSAAVLRDERREAEIAHPQTAPVHST